MGLRQPFALINSQFNDFLFAPIGEEGNGMTLSVISALTRLDIDPWREAARLSGLSKERAAQALATIIARLSGGHWTLGDIPEIAARLVAVLPQRGAAARSLAAPSRGRAFKPTVRAVCLLVFVLLSVAWIATEIHVHRAPRHADATEDASISPPQP